MFRFVFAWCGLMMPLVALAETFKIHFQPDWFPNSQFAGFVWAQEAGYYAEAGLDVEIGTFDFATDFIGKVASGEPAIGTIEAYMLLDQVGKGQPLVALGALLAQSPAGYIYLADSGIAEPADLAGKKVGVHNYAEKLLRFFVEEAGLPAGAAEMVMAKHHVEWLLEGKVDLHQGYAIDEMLRLEAMTERPVDILLFEDLGLPLYSMVLYTSQAFYEAHPEQVAAFLAATKRGWMAALDEPEKVASLMAETCAHPEVPDALRAPHLRKMEVFIRPEGHEMLSMSRARWEAMHAAFLRSGMISTPVDFEALLVED